MQQKNEDFICLFALKLRGFGWNSLIAYQEGNFGRAHPTAAHVRLARLGVIVVRTAKYYPILSVFLSMSGGRAIEETACGDFCLFFWRRGLKLVFEKNESNNVSRRKNNEKSKQAVSAVYDADSFELIFSKFGQVVCQKKWKTYAKRHHSRMSYVRAQVGAKRKKYIWESGKISGQQHE